MTKTERWRRYIIEFVADFIPRMLAAGGYQPLPAAEGWYVGLGDALADEGIDVAEINIPIINAAWDLYRVRNPRR